MAATLRDVMDDMDQRQVGLQRTRLKFPANLLMPLPMGMNRIIDSIKIAAHEHGAQDAATPQTARNWVPRSEYPHRRREWKHQRRLQNRVTEFR
jgi:hypothetical protein